MSEDYETAQEDLSDTGGNLNVDEHIFSFHGEPPDLHRPTRQKVHPLGYSEKTRRINGRISVTGSGRKGEHLLSSARSDDDGANESALLRAMKKIVGYSESASGDESSESDVLSLHKTKRFAKKSTSLHAHSGGRPSSKSARVTDGRKNVSIKAILQCQPVVQLTRMSLSRKQVDKARQMLLKSYSKESSKSKSINACFGESSVVGEVDHDSFTVSSSLCDDRQETKQEEDATPRSSKPPPKRCLSLTLPKKHSFSEFATPNFQSLKRPNVSLSSAKRKLMYNHSSMWSSDSDFDNTPHSEHPSSTQKAAVRSLSNDVKHIKNLPSTTKKKKILSSYSSGEEEMVTPHFLQKQRAEKKEAQVKDEGNNENGAAFDGDPFDKSDEDDDKAKGTEFQIAANFRHTKLGKYEKSPGGKGKEKATKASTLPEKIPCAACGKNIYWKTKKIHAHPRLAVLICQQCHGKFNQGTFKVEGDNEIYCTLCGDGGNIVLCSFSEHSFCQECIKRHSGEKHLRYLLSSDDVDFKCYMCDPTDVKKLQDLCEEVCYHFKASSTKRRKEFKSRKYVEDSDTTTSKSRDNSFDDSDGGGVAPFSGGLSSGGGGSNGGLSSNSQGESSKRRGRSGKRLPEQQECTDSGADNRSLTASLRGDEVKETRQSQKSEKTGTSDKGKKGGKISTSKVKTKGRSGTAKNVDDGDSSSDSMSYLGESSEVNTDDISLSDSSLFEVVRAKKSKKEKAKERGREKERILKRKDSKESDKEEKEERQPSRKKTKKRRRIIVGHLHESVMDESDFESSDSEDVDRDQLQPPKRKNKKRKNSSSSDSGSKPLKKRGRLGSTLSSGSSSSDEERLAVSVSDLELDGIESGGSENELFNDRMSEDKGSQSIKYLTPVKLDSHVISSDSDVVPLKRTKKKETSRQLFGRNSSMERDIEDDEAVPTATKKKTKVYKTRNRKRQKGEGGSSDDFMSDDLSLRGPRLNARHKRLRLASFLSSDDSSDENLSGKKKKGTKQKDGEEGETPSTPGQKRKNIRKLIADEKLATSTRAAQREEEERLKRLKEKAKFLTPIEDSERVILEQDPETKEAKVGQTYCHNERHN